MNQPLPPDANPLQKPRGVLFWLSLFIVIAGLMNAIPGVPGLDAGLRNLTGLDWIKIRRFPTEWFYPLAFGLMMLCVVLKHSAWKSWKSEPKGKRQFGLLLDLAMVAAAFTISFTYIVEIESICLIDQFTGERDRLIAEALRIETEIADTMGLPAPTTVEDPSCVANTGGWLVLIIGLTVLIFLAYNVRVWGLALVLVALVVALYTIITVLVWYFHGPEDINKYLMTKLAGEPRALADGRPRVHDILVNNSAGLLGRFMNIMLNTIFPYLVLGSLFGASAGGQSLIKLAFRWTRKLRGGPAHAAIVSSAMFGTISGGPIVNVLSTGVLTIPMMLRRGFSKVFAGGVEAAASSGGSIMPPVMGVAAFVLASLTVVPYSQVIIAAIIPAIAYFFCLFLSVIFQTRKQKIEAIGELTDDMRMSRQDILNLAMIFGPILLILVLLLTTKEMVGCGLLGGVLGAERSIVDGACTVQSLSWFQQAVQNAAGDAGSAGWWAVMLLIALLFVDPEVRKMPSKIVDALSDAGILVSTLYLMFLAVSIIDFCLQFTGLPNFISLDVLGWLQTLNLGQDGAVGFQLIALLVTMFIAILLGMGMPAVPAYINVALLMGPVLAGLGIATFTAHMFIFYFAVASAITPPIALAAFAAASITKANPMATGFSAVKSGIVMFVIPFVFALYPEILLIEAAVIDPVKSASGVDVFLPGYDGTTNWPALMLVLCRIALALYLLSSSLAGFDHRKLAAWEILLRLGLAVLILSFSIPFQLVGVIGAMAILFWHASTERRKPA
ncbi:TRAP transporter fused permease subunit [Planktotalea sp.]|uniref:TRAP transporter fused permease subunit n=1 Tax=Planktotalea sp. TaxID=2029877 RepID=UPI003D6C65CC